MMPLSLAGIGDKVMVARVGGSAEDKQHLADLGFVEGAVMTVINNTGDGNIIVNIKESRLAITAQIAARVMVVPRSSH